MADTDDTRLEQTIEAERARLLQVHSILHCLYEVLLYAEHDEAETYAEVAHLAAMLIDDVVERLDPIKLRPMIEAARRSARPDDNYPLPQPRGLTTGAKDDDDGNVVKEPRMPWPCYTH